MGESLDARPSLRNRNPQKARKSARQVASKGTREEGNKSPSCSKRERDSPLSSGGYYRPATKRGIPQDLDDSKGREPAGSVEEFRRLVWAEKGNERRRLGSASFPSLRLSISFPCTHPYPPNNHQLILPNASQKLSRMTPSKVPNLVFVMLESGAHDERELGSICLDV